MRLGRLRGPLIGALVCSLVAFAGCGGPPSDGQVSDETSKNPVLLEAMGGYMNKRNQGKGGRKAAKSGAAKGSQAAPKEAASE